MSLWTSSIAGLRTPLSSIEQPYLASLRCKELEDSLLTMHSSLICAFNQLLDMKDLNTGFHSTRLAEWSVRVAKDLGMDDKVLKDVDVAALLHDIGKMGVRDSILRKPDKLTKEEYEVMKKHPEYSWAIVRLFPDFDRASMFVLHHHESYDGKGYPGHLKATEIPIGARLVAVIDSFDAMVSSRPYREGLPLEEALRRLISASGTQFDPLVVQSFIRIAQAEFPAVFAATGTLTTVSL